MWACRSMPDWDLRLNSLRPRCAFDWRVSSALPRQQDGDVVLALGIMRPRADVVGDDVDDVVERLVRVLNQEIGKPCRFDLFGSRVLSFGEAVGVRRQQVARL